MTEDTEAGVWTMTEYRVIADPYEDGFVGTCDAFPSLSWCAPTEAAALAGIEALVAEVRLDLECGG